ncbi:Uncharacterised protein [Serratia fonticola]|uniref:winged helix-turn-helix domain-containing protein n=1 Tax=Serratia fonticola TaxID=47917 RepID=UPI00218282E3|nr:hypothetical protein [Serratia fonticola]CAI2533037.1 Uncharacterised protein [Serratia fonticola]
MFNVIFNNIIHYNAEEGTLCRLDNPENVLKLYYSANRCLQILIEAYPTPVLQRFFLENVWEKNDQSATANTFYQCISTIRKAFSSLSLNEDVIITIPRKGVCISTNISIDVLNTNVVTEQKKLSTNSGGYFRKKTFITLTIISMIPIIGLFYVSILHQEKQSKLSNIYKKIGGYQKCAIYIDKSETTDMENILNVISKQNVKCDTKANIYYSSMKSPIKESAIVCYEEKQGKCISIYRVN